jgi:dTDP-4-dehydrorhamnose 3,5-epimerase-like enzyme
MKIIKTIKGGTFEDNRGKIRYVNDFRFEGVKRFYFISHPDTSIVRAWQGHRFETKYFYVTKGSFNVCWIEIDNWDHPSKELPVQCKMFNDHESKVLVIPPGHVNGFKALEPDSTLIVYSDKTLEESKTDDYRFPVDYWIFCIEQI